MARCRKCGLHEGDCDCPILTDMSEEEAARLRNDLEEQGDELVCEMCGHAISEGDDAVKIVRPSDPNSATYGHKDCSEDCEL